MVVVGKGPVCLCDVSGVGTGCVVGRAPVVDYDLPTAIDFTASAQSSLGLALVLRLFRH